MNHDSFSNNNQLVISYELLTLLQWLVENHDNELKAIISGALKDGLKTELKKMEANKDLHCLEDVHLNIIEFFGLLESLLLETMHEQAVKKALEKKLMPAIEHIDSTVCDDATVRFSIEKASANIENENSPEHAQELLFKEILKRWKPKKAGVN